MQIVNPSDDIYYLERRKFGNVSKRTVVYNSSSVKVPKVFNILGPPTELSEDSRISLHDDLGYAASCGFIVPQQVYEAPTVYEPLPPIRFYAHGTPGVRLVDAMQGSLPYLDNRNFAPAVSRRSGRTALRILWPGYNDWQYTSISIQHHTAQATGYTMEELAYTMAKHIQHFYHDMASEICRDRSWSIRNIPFEKLYLLELRHVHTGSWQPVLYYRI
ncbi:hypothetical protein BC835DRAFT_1416616 [Cytidiella melzeri]|nr:hypothetical protein BC835DRAFT_1416616 [Cytidiella melzeri]